MYPRQGFRRYGAAGVLQRAFAFGRFALSEQTHFVGSQAHNRLAAYASWTDSFRVTAESHFCEKPHNG